MRELKFRAWDKYYKMWAYKDGKVNKPNCEYSDESEYYYDDEWYPFSDVKVIRQFELNIKEYEKRIIIEQYTGLKDKNGKEVYDGDIIKWGNIKNDGMPIEEIGTIAPIAYEKSIYGFWADGNELIYLSYHEFEIIGNIHENPELLEQK